ncbi:MAG: redoxin domain-containing protein [Pseudomonadota bacterium]
MRLAPVLIFIVLAALLGIALTRQSEPVAPGAATDKPFPSFALTALDGTTQWSSDALKGQVTVINVFASWCAPCAEEMPQFAALKKQFPTVRFEGIAWNDDPATLKKWLATNGNPFGTVWLDPKGDATIALGIKGIPETFVVDGQGTLRYRLPGVLTADLATGEFALLLTALQNANQLQGIAHGR